MAVPARSVVMCLPLLGLATVNCDKGILDNCSLLFHGTFLYLLTFIILLWEYLYIHID